MTSEADPLPVALPELPTVAWLDELTGNAEPFADSTQVIGLVQGAFTKPGPFHTRLDLVRKSDAEAALRAQAEEVERLRALLLDARLFAESCPADMGRGSLNGMRVQLLHAIDAHLKDKP